MTHGGSVGFLRLSLSGRSNISPHTFLEQGHELHTGLPGEGAAEVRQLWETNPAVLLLFFYLFRGYTCQCSGSFWALCSVIAPRDVQGTMQ